MPDNAMEPAAKLLKVILDKCRGAAVSEVRFVSGMSPTFVDSDGPHFIEVGDLSRELVGEVHALCLSLADTGVAEAGSATTYAFTLKQLGRIRCEYQFRGNAASLTLEFDPDAADRVESIKPRRAPTLGAAARPGSRRKGR